MAAADFEQIARELYALAPEEFIAARNARASDAGDRALAAQIRALRKPLLAAWVVNLYAREHATELGQALELAAELREAQAELDAPTLTRLGRERRALVRSLAQQATKLAADRGDAIAASTTEAVTQTLNAAMFDAAAAAAVASGRLVRPLAVSGGDAVDLSDAVAGDLDVTAGEPKPPTDELRARRERKERERAVRAAESRAHEAARAQAELDRKWRATTERADDLAARAEQLEAQLARTRADAEHARAESEELAAARAAAVENAAAAERVLAEARARLDG